MLDQLHQIHLQLAYNKLIVKSPNDDFIIGAFLSGIKIKNSSAIKKSSHTGTQQVFPQFHLSFQSKRQ